MAELTVDDLLAQISPREITVGILLRQDLVNRFDELEAALNREVQIDATENREPLAPGLAVEIKALEAEMKAAEVPFTFRAVGQRKWADLLAAHPPTKEQRKENPRADHNPATFPVVAVAASCVQPKLTEEQVTRFFEGLAFAQWDALWSTCCSVNVGTSTLPKSWAAGAIAQANQELGLPATGTASPEAFSLAGS